MTSPPLDKVLEFMRVLWALDHALQERSKAMASKLGVTSPQRLALRIIDGQPGISSGQVAALLHLDPSTLTGVLRRLEARRLLVRKKDKADGRRARLEITAQGRALLGQQQHTIEAVVRVALDAEKEKAVRKASGVLQRLTAALGQAPAPMERLKRAR
jgi:DNA-binding MarR family transcriptional regulator